MWTDVSTIGQEYASSEVLGQRGERRRAAFFCSDFIALSLGINQAELVVSSVPAV